MNKYMTKERELTIWRDWLHSFYTARHITMDGPTIMHLFYYLDKWGRAHTVGNGEIDNAKLVRSVLLEMESCPWSDSNWNSKKDTRFKKEYKENAKRWNRKQKSIEKKRQKRLINEEVVKQKKADKLTENKQKKA